MNRPDDTEDMEDVVAVDYPDELIEELVRGAFEPGLPDELVNVGRLLRAAHGPIPGEDRSRETEVVDAMLDAMKVVPLTAASSAGARRESGSARRRTRRMLVAVTAAAGVLGVGGVAAAAGNLPSPIQSFVHETLSQIGVAVPHPDDEPAPTDRTQDTDENEADVPSTDDQPGNRQTQTDDTPGKSGEAPGRTGDTPGQSGESPGKSEDAPGHTGDNPSKGGEPPGQSGSAPGQAGEPPGQSATAPGQSGSPPGQTNASGNEVNAEAPGQQRN